MRHAKSRLVEDADLSAPVRLETVPTGPDKSGSKPRSESVYLFLEFTINGNASYCTYIYIGLTQIEQEIGIFC